MVAKAAMENPRAGVVWQVGYKLSFLSELEDKCPPLRGHTPPQKDPKAHFILPEGTEDNVFRKLRSLLQVNSRDEKAPGPIGSVWLLPWSRASPEVCTVKYRPPSPESPACPQLPPHSCPMSPSRP